MLCLPKSGNCFETTQSQIYPKPLLCFDSHLLVSTSRCSSQHPSVICSKHCLYLQSELTPTGTPVRLKTQTLPDHSLKNARWGVVRHSLLLCVHRNIYPTSIQHLINRSPAGWGTRLLPCRWLPYSLETKHLIWVWIMKVKSSWFYWSTICGS